MGCRLDERSHRAAGDPAACAAAGPTSAAADRPNQTQGPWMNDRQSLIGWTISYLAPYRGRMTLVTVLLLFEVALGALQPWPFKVVIDYVLVPQPIPEPFAGWLATIRVGSRFALLVTFVVAGVVLQVVNQLVTASNTQLQVETGQQ